MTEVGEQISLVDSKYISGHILRYILTFFLNLKSYKHGVFKGIITDQYFCKCTGKIIITSQA